jgi:3-oxoacyl-(acyl-carrier-protein) synthase
MTGAGYCVLRGEQSFDATAFALNIQYEDGVGILPWLKTPKMKKFMGKQDQLAVVAAGRAITSAGLTAQQLGLRTGIYMAVGYIPFEREEIEALTKNSAEAGKFSMQRFSLEGIE